MRMLEIDLPVPDHTPLSRRACGLPAKTPRRNKTRDLELIVDSTGLKLRGAGEWLFERHGTAKRRAWQKLHIGIDARSGDVAAFDLTNKDVDDASHVETLLAQLDAAPASFLADGAYDRASVLDAVLAGNPSARFVVPPCKGGRNKTNCRNNTDPTRSAYPLGRGAQADELAEGLRLQQAFQGRGGKCVIGDALHSRQDAQLATEIAVAVKSLNRMREFGQAKFVRVA